MKGMYLSPAAAAAAAGIAGAAPPTQGLQGNTNNHFPLNSVVPPSVPSIPVPTAAALPLGPVMREIVNMRQTVKIVFIIGYGFENVDIINN
jgi:hypothetical protein